MFMPVGSVLTDRLPLSIRADRNSCRTHLFVVLTVAWAMLANAAQDPALPVEPASSDSTFTVAMAAGDSAFHAFDNVGARHHYAAAVVIDSTNFDALWKLARAYTD